MRDPLWNEESLVLLRARIYEYPSQNYVFSHTRFNLGSYCIIHLFCLSFFLGVIHRLCYRANLYSTQAPIFPPHHSPHSIPPHSDVFLLCLRPSLWGLFPVKTFIIPCPILLLSLSPFHTIVHAALNKVLFYDSPTNHYLLPSVWRLSFVLASYVLFHHPPFLLPTCMMLPNFLRYCSDLLHSAAHVSLKRYFASSGTLCCCS